MSVKNIQSNLKMITSGQIPSTEQLKSGELAFGLVNGQYKIYGNVDGNIVSYNDKAAPGGYMLFTTTKALIPGTTTNWIDFTDLAPTTLSVKVNDIIMTTSGENPCYRITYTEHQSDRVGVRVEYVTAMRGQRGTNGTNGVKLFTCRDKAITNVTGNQFTATTAKSNVEPQNVTPAQGDLLLITTNTSTNGNLYTIWNASLNFSNWQITMEYASNMLGPTGPDGQTGPPGPQGEKGDASVTFDSDNDSEIAQNRILISSILPTGVTPKINDYVVLVTNNENRGNMYRIVSFFSTTHVVTEYVTNIVGPGGGDKVAFFNPNSTDETPFNGYKVSYDKDTGELTAITSSRSKARPKIDSVITFAANYNFGEFKDLAYYIAGDELVVEYITDNDELIPKVLGLSFDMFNPNPRTLQITLPPIVGHFMTDPNTEAFISAYEVINPFDMTKMIVKVYYSETFSLERKIIYKFPNTFGTYNSLTARMYGIRPRSTEYASLGVVDQI